MTRPRLVTGARLRYDEVREEHVLLIPEGAVRLNPTAAEVLWAQLDAIERGDTQPQGRLA